MEDLPSNITVVTFYFDLNEREESRSGGRSYLELGDRILGLDANMFIMVDPKLVPRIWRKRRNFSSKTCIYPIEFEHTPHYSKRVEIEKMFAKGNRPAGSSKTKDSPLYFILTWTKIWALDVAMKMNLFDSDSFFWLDFGLFHLWSDKDAKLEELKVSLGALSSESKISICIVKEMREERVLDPKAYYSEMRQLCAGGYFGGSRASLKWLSDRFKEELRVSLTYCPSLEEAIIGRIYVRNRDRFKVKYGDYWDLISLQRPNSRNLFVLAQCLNSFRIERDWERASYIVDYAFESPHWSNIVEEFQHISGDRTRIIANLLTFLDEVLISMWWSNRKTDSRRAAEMIVDLMKENKDIIDSKQYRHLEDNIRFHDLKLEETPSS